SPQSLAWIASSGRNNTHVPGLFFPQGQMVAAKAELDGVAQWRPADDFDLGSVAESHLKQATAYFGVAAHGRDVAAAADAELV
ncbi:MAG TPA: hypothetical protein VG269_29280, partial [Tepidisphaeraceae bacterium]|nr:hypothetical protein [Tepidisphaeraceae bacterium]